MVKIDILNSMQWNDIKVLNWNIISLYFEGFEWGFGFEQHPTGDHRWLYQSDFGVRAVDQPHPEQHGDGDPGSGDHCTAQTAESERWGISV